MKMWRYGDLNKTSRYHDDDVTLQLTNDFAALRRIFLLLPLSWMKPQTISPQFIKVIKV